MQRWLSGFLVLLLSTVAWASQPSITGTVTDSLGAVIPGAKIVLLEKGKQIDSTTSDSTGKFQVQHRSRRPFPSPGRG